MIAAWNRFFHEPSDPRIPALIRMGVAGLLLVNLIAWFPYLEMWFGDTGVLPGDVWRNPDEQTSVLARQWSLLAMVPRGHFALQACFWIFALQSVCLLCGFASRFSAASVFVWLVSFQNRNQLILDGEDDVLRLISFFLIFMPLAEVWSVDAWLRRRSSKVKSGDATEPTYQSHCSPWAQRMLQYVMVLVMLATGLWKLSGEHWRDGTALYYVARIDDLFGRFPVPHYLFDTPWTVRAMTWCVLYVELAIPFLIWVPKARRFALFVLLGFHLSNEWAMHLFLFHWIMLCGWMSFLKKEDLDAVAKFCRRFAGRSQKSSGALTT
ncbi:MAG: HTTM domain-containing protein [Pirellulaceae bacterium]